MNMDCFNYSCPLRVNESSNVNRCECIYCTNRNNHDEKIYVSNKTVLDNKNSTEQSSSGY